MVKFKVLCLDGGGIKGVLTSVWLTELHRRLGGNLSDHFDLISGTSSGSIIACALRAGYAPAEIMKMYEQEGKTIFPSGPARWWDSAAMLLKAGLSRPRYDGEGLKKVLHDKLKGKTFGELGAADKKTMVFAYNISCRELVAFKSWRPKYADLPAWQVVKASCSAPTYFPAQQIELEGAEQDDRIGRKACPQKRYPFVDGGVAANNPTACAIAEVFRLHGHKIKPGEILVASMGTGKFTRQYSERDGREWGLLEWAAPIIDIFMDGSTQSMQYVAQQTLPEGSYFRFQTPLEKAYDDMDNADATNIEALKRTALAYLDSATGAENMDKTVAALAPEV